MTDAALWFIASALWFISYGVHRIAAAIEKSVK